MTTITEKHTSALTTHTADALGVTNDKARVLLAAMLGDAPTYTDLRMVDVSVVTEGMRQVDLTPPAIKRAAVAALVAGLMPGAETCNRCGRLRLSLAGSTWQTVTAPACPVDAGLYEAQRVEVVLGWHDGREYPAGTTHDTAGVPITEVAVRAERPVDGAVMSALAETGASLLDVLASLTRGGMSPAAALTTIGAPLTHWPSAVALRAAVASAKGSASMPRGGGGPRLEPMPRPAGVYSRPEYRRVLAGLYPSPANARRVAYDARLDTSRIDFGGGAAAAWEAVLIEAERDGKVDALMGIARREYPGNPGLAALSGGAGVNLDNLSGKDWAELQAALLSAFPNCGAFDQLVGFATGEARAKLLKDGNLNSMTYELIEWAQSRGKTGALIRTAREMNNGNPRLAAFAARCGL